MKRVAIALMALCGVLLVSSRADAGRIGRLPDGAGYFADRVIVIMNTDSPSLVTDRTVDGYPSTGIESIDRLCRDLNITGVEPLYRGILRKPALIRELSRIYVFRLAEFVDPQTVIPSLSNDTHIRTAELCTVPDLNYEPNDPFFGLQWYLMQTHAAQAWDIVRGDTTKHSIIAIVDTGVDWENEDIMPNVWINAGEDINHNGIFDSGDNNGIDDDNNGFVDDVVGWDFGANDNDPKENYAIHGTPVASSASEATDNDLLGAGMGFSARLMCLKAADGNGNFPVNIWESMIYAGDNGAQIVNCSWGTTTFSQYEQDIINALWEEDVLVTGSAGARSDSVRMYPAAYTHVMAVAATDQNDQKAQFSGYGAWVDICAPGVNIYTVYGDDYSLMSGTSFSTGLASGLAALIRAWYPELTNDETEQLIKDSADPIDDINPGYAGMLGAGRINASASFRTAVDQAESMPIRFAFDSNYPNPFNASTVLRYSLSNQSSVTLEIYNLVGQKIVTIFQGDQSAGPHSVTWDASAFPSGVYFANLKTDGGSKNIKMTLLK